MQSSSMKCALHLSVGPNSRHNLNKKLHVVNFTRWWIDYWISASSDVCSVVAVAGLQVMRSPLNCWDLGQNVPNRWHSLEQWFLQLAIATWKVALVRFAKGPVSGGWRRTWEVFPWLWNVKSIFPNTNMDRLGHTVGDLQLSSFTFALCINSIYSLYSYLEHISYLEQF